ncbi:replication factor A protein 2, partial [Cladochytrium tenue]
MKDVSETAFATLQIVSRSSVYLLVDCHTATTFSAFLPLLIASSASPTSEALHFPASAPTMMGSTGYGGYNSNFGGGGGGGFNNRNNNNFGGGGGGAFSNFNSYSAANNSPAGGGGGGYGGFGGGGGGTFSPSQTNSPGTGAKPRTSWSARPVTIKHLLTASQEVGGENALFELDGHEFSTAVVVGRVQRATSTSTFTSYIIEDGTGQIDIRKWVQKSNESDFDAAAEETYPVGAYLRVVGAMRPYQGKTYLQAHAIFPIQSVDEITYHILDAVYAHLYITRGGAPSA